MTMADDGTHNVLAQADALMRRHRKFLAGTVDTAAQAVMPVADEDIPVLTEVVDAPDLSPALSAQDLEQHHQRLSEIATAVLTQWIDEELPQAVLNIMDGFSDQIVAALTDRAKTDLLQRLQQELDDASKF